MLLLLRYSQTTYLFLNCFYFRSRLFRRQTTRGSDIDRSSYTMISENAQRRATMPTKVRLPSVLITTPSEQQLSETNTPTGMTNRRRKFIVTPAEDPLHYIPLNDRDEEYDRNNSSV